MSANPDTITVSGMSAGCYMSELLTFIHSDTIKGSALFQCFPYGIYYYDEYWDTETAESIKNLAVPRIDAAVAAGEIDDTANLPNRSIYIYSGLRDGTMYPVG
jgi:hypothetical protein